MPFVITPWDEASWRVFESLEEADQTAKALSTRMPAHLDGQEIVVMQVLPAPSPGKWPRADPSAPDPLARYIDGRRIYQIDGRHFWTLEEFYGQISRILIPGAAWGRNLDAFNDILSGGFGTPEDGFTFRWRHHQTSQERLGYEETVRQLELILFACHPTARSGVQERLDRARSEEGPTVFDWLVEILADHEPDVTLELA